MTSEVASKVESFFTTYPVRRFKKGQILIFAGDDPTKIMYLEKGQVRQYDISYRGDEVVVNIYKPPAFLPMQWALTKLPNRFFFDAFTDIEVRQAPADKVIEWLGANADVTLDLLTRLYSGVDGLLQRMAHLMGGSAKSRVLFELLLESRRFGKETGNGQYELALNESELGARSGLSRETVNRELHKLKRQGLIQVVRQGMVIQNISLLEQELGQGL